MRQAARHGLSNLLTIDGRDDNQSFWQYVLLVFIFDIVVVVALAVPAALKAVTLIVRAAVMSDGNDELLRSVVSESIGHTLATIGMVSLVVFAITVIFLATAIVRRLHDTGLSGHWAVLPAICMTIAQLQLYLQITTVQHGLTDMIYGKSDVASIIFDKAYASGWAVGLIGIILICVLAARESDPEPNRFGDFPFSV
ncbi:MAG: DUF805 domain-containing protein [Novosphingobium sp.]